jgi:hypothetical protein
MSSVAEEPVSEARVERGWRHPSEALVDDEAGASVLDRQRCLHRRRFARSSAPRTRLIETRIHGPAATQEALANSFHPGERQTSFGEPGGPEDGCARCFGTECASSFGLDRTPDSELEKSSREDSGLSGGDGGEVAFARSVDAFVPVDDSTELGTRRRSYSEREAQGHERAAAVVHPI